MKRICSVCLLLTIVCLFFASCGGEETITIRTKPVSTVLDKLSGAEKWQDAVDYSAQSNWLAYNDEGKRADVIYFYPGLYEAEEGGDEVCAVDNEDMRASAPKYLSTQAAVFTEECNLYAPFYRQIDKSFLYSVERADRERLFEYSASKDASAALDYYFEHCNNGKPFILAGHDQGSDIVRYLVGVYLNDHPEYMSRLIAAYAIGTAVTDTFLNKYHLKFASGEDDTGVIVSYNTEGQGNYNFSSTELIVLRHTKVINPLSWSTTDKNSVLYSAHHGMLMPDGTIEDCLFGTHLNLTNDRGTVVVDEDEMEIYAMTGRDAELFGPQCYHTYDYEFFFVNLRENVETRVEAWFKRNR